MGRKEQIDAMEEIIDRAYYKAAGVGAVRPSSRMIAIDLYDAGFEKRMTKIQVIKTELTHEVIDAVLSLDLGRRKFKNPRIVRKICEMRLTGATYKEIGKKTGLSGNRCQDVVHRVEYLYKIYCEK